MIEAEAKEKVCPIFDVSTLLGMLGVLYTKIQGHDVSDSSVDRIVETHQCKGSACMMWRKLQMSEGGYCGLAGKP